MSIAFDSTASAYLAPSGTSKSVTLSTSGTNRLVLVAVMYSATVSSITATGLTFTKLTTVVANCSMDIWWAYATSTLSSASVTVNFSSSSFASILINTFSGADTTTPIAVYAASAQTTTPYSQAITTNAVNELVCLFAGNSNGYTYTAGTGYTIAGQIANGYPGEQYSVAGEYGNSITTTSGTTVTPTINGTSSASPTWPVIALALQPPVPQRRRLCGVY